MQAAGKARLSRPGRFFYGEFGARHYTHIYAVGPKGGGCIKFGRAKNVKSRFSGIQTGSPVKLEIIGSSLLPVEVEDGIHDHLADHHSHGEWFLPTMKVVAIAELIRDKKHVELLTRIGLYKILPDHVVSSQNFAERMDESTPANAECEEAHSGSSIYSDRLVDQAEENIFYPRPRY